MAADVDGKAAVGAGQQLAGLQAQVGLGQQAAIERAVAYHHAGGAQLTAAAQGGLAKAGPEAVAQQVDGGGFGLQRGRGFVAR